MNQKVSREIGWGTAATHRTRRKSQHKLTIDQQARKARSAKRKYDRDGKSKKKGEMNLATDHQAQPQPDKNGAGDSVKPDAGLRMSL